MTHVVAYVAVVIALAGLLCCHHGEGARHCTRKKPS